VLDPLDILVDVGGEYDVKRSRFDHHQKGFFETFSPEHKTKLSSAGLIYKHFGEEVLTAVLQVEPSNPLVAYFHKKIYEVNHPTNQPTTTTSLRSPRATGLLPFFVCVYVEGQVELLLSVPTGLR